MFDLVVDMFYLDCYAVPVEFKGCKVIDSNEFYWHSSILPLLPGAMPVVARVDEKSMLEFLEPFV